MARQFLDMRLDGGTELPDHTRPRARLAGQGLQFRPFDRPDLGAGLRSKGRINLAAGCEIILHEIKDQIPVRFGERFPHLLKKAQKVVFVGGPTTTHPSTVSKSQTSNG